jgi:hypothetical protein
VSPFRHSSAEGPAESCAIELGTPPGEHIGEEGSKLQADYWAGIQLARPTLAEKATITFHFSRSCSSKGVATMTRKSRFSFTILSAWILAVLFTTVGLAQVVTGSKPKADKTELKLRVPTRIAGITLEPGQYTVAIVPPSNGSGEPTVLFFRSIYKPYNEYLQGTGSWHQEVVLTVKASTKALATPAASTELVPSSIGGNEAKALEIRSDSTEYIFDVSKMPAKNR